MALIVFGWNIDAVANCAKMNGVDAAVLLIPSTIAASVLIVVETSTLSTELDKRGRYVVAFILFALWVSAIILYFNGNISIGNASPAPVPCPSI